MSFDPLAPVTAGGRMTAANLGHRGRTARKYVFRPDAGAPNQSGSRVKLHDTPKSAIRFQPRPLIPSLWRFCCTFRWSADKQLADLAEAAKLSPDPESIRKLNEESALGGWGRRWLDKGGRFAADAGPILFLQHSAWRLPEFLVYHYAAVIQRIQNFQPIVVAKISGTCCISAHVSQVLGMPCFKYSKLHSRL